MVTVEHKCHVRIELLHVAWITQSARQTSLLVTVAASLIFVFACFQFPVETGLRSCRLPVKIKPNGTFLTETV